MTKTVNITPRLDRGITIGPRLRRELELQLRELLNRDRPKILELAEIAKLRELLRTGGGND